MVSGSRLASFFEGTHRPPKALHYYELEGFLFAVVAAPELVPPSEWVPFVFGDDEPAFDRAEDAQGVLTDLMALYNRIASSVTDERVALPAGCVFRADTLSNFDDDAPISQWSRGFVWGHQWLENAWSPYVPGDFDEQFSTMLIVLSFFSSRQIADAFLKELGRSDIEETAARFHQVFPAIMAEYARLGRSIQQALLPDDRAPVQPKIGRNTPCPCGSGRKYKKCCGSA